MKSEKLATALDKMGKKREIMAWRVLLCAAFFILHSSLFISCSEEQAEDAEYANWQTRNEAYFEQQYQQHLAASTADCFVLRSVTQPSSLELKDIEHTNCILVDVISHGDENGDVAYFNDVAEVHYEGRLIPSKSYSAGYVFDCSWDGDFDPAVANPYETEVNGVVNGFFTALSNMHVGDRWRVTIPYQLGYGVSGSGDVPGYSTLIFDIRLAGVTHNN